MRQNSKLSRSCEITLQIWTWIKDIYKNEALSNKTPAFT